MPDKTRPCDGFYLFSSRFFFVFVALMDQEVVREDIVGNPAEVHLEEASGLVSSVACEPLVAPAGHRIQRTEQRGSGFKKVLTS